MPTPYVNSTQVASSVPFDNSTNGFVSTDAQAAIEEAAGHFCFIRAISNNMSIPSGVTCFARAPVVAAGVSVSVLGSGEWYVL